MGTKLAAALGMASLGGTCLLAQTSAAVEQTAPQVSVAPFAPRNEVERRLVERIQGVCARVAEVGSGARDDPIHVLLFEPPTGEQGPQLKVLFKTVNRILQPGGTILVDSTYWLDKKHPERTSEESLLIHLPAIVVSLQYEPVIRAVSDRISESLLRVSAENNASDVNAVKTSVETVLRRMGDLRAAHISERLLKEHLDNSTKARTRVETLERLTSSTSRRSLPTAQELTQRQMNRQISMAQKNYRDALEEVLRLTGRPPAAIREIEKQLQEALKPAPSTRGSNPLLREP